MHSSDSREAPEAISVGQLSDAERPQSQLVAVETARDRRVLIWLISQVGEGAVAAACHQLAGQRRPYVSNVAKVLGLTPPDDIALTPLNDAKRRLAQCKALLQRGK